MIKEGVAEETRKLVIPKQSKGKINNMQSQSSGLNKLNKNNPDKSEDNGKDKSFTFGKRGNVNVVKSPSDTTLYAPALKHTSQESRQGENLIQQISEFVDEI